MIHFENIYRGAAGGEAAEGEKEHGREKQRGEKKKGKKRKEKRGITRKGSNQGSEITEGPGVRALRHQSRSAVAARSLLSGAVLPERPPAGARVYTR